MNFPENDEFDSPFDPSTTRDKRSRKKRKNRKNMFDEGKMELEELM